MAQTKLSREEVARRAEELYNQTLREKLEAAPDNIGKMVVIDARSGDYEVDEDSLEAADRLEARHPDAQLYGMRIGYDVVYSFAGSLEPAKR